MESLFTARESAGIKMAERWSKRYASLDRPPWLDHLGDIQDEILLADTVISLAMKLEARHG